MSVSNRSKIAELLSNGPAIDRALQKAVRKALEEHKKAGRPVVVWQDGQIKWLQPHEIPVTDEPDSQSDSGDPDVGP